MSIDWSKAPEGFPIWLEDIRPSKRSGDSKDRSSWAKDGDGEYTLCGVTIGWWAKSREGHDFIAHQKPAQWNEEGLPPVGTVCEHHKFGRAITTGAETIVKIIAHITDDKRISPVAVYMPCEGNPPCVGQGTADAFRPIRTPEQIAADERAANIEAMRADIGWKAPYLGPCPVALLYDAGYRKQSQP